MALFEKTCYITEKKKKTFFDKKKRHQAIK